MTTAHQPPPPSSMVNVVRQVVGRRTVLAIDGEVDIGTVDSVAAAIDQVIADGAAELWLDLSMTTFMDSGGLHVIMDTRQRLTELNRRLAIVAPGDGLRRLFDVAGVTGLLTIYEDRHAAHLGG